MSEIKGYHAHVYYNAETKPKAAQAARDARRQVQGRAGALSDEPRGPHPVSQFNVIFETPGVPEASCRG